MLEKMKNTFVLCFSFFMLAVQSCTNPVTVRLGEGFKIRYGQQVTVQDGGPTVRFKAVAEDSRCPRDAVCIWSGNAKIVLQVSQTDMALNTDLDPKQAPYLSYTIQLLSLDPYPRTDRQVKLEDYIADLLVTRN